MHENKNNSLLENLIYAGLAVASGAFLYFTSENHENILDLPDVEVQNKPQVVLVNPLDIDQSINLEGLGYELDRHIVLDAKHLIIQVDMVHGVSELKNPSSKFLTMQERSSQLARKFVEQFRLKQIYHDGIHKNNAKLIAALTALNENTSLSVQKRERLVGEINNLTEQSKSLSLGFNGVIIRPTENEELLKKAKKETTMRRDTSEINDSREDFIIKRIIQDRNKTGLLIVGAGHNLKNNIVEWNNANPKDKISYLVFRPNGMPETRDLNELAKWAKSLF